ncbi:VanZ family protein [Quadrisphaera sp. INWT6]|uniref:VanZ family protein n=1 Tax=Quadrisphaera sp. INWT6 TaxID=2596917 RepID=UPI001892713F|nr:VanZ family protein [Quadrisphaera sp. INWT6]
MPDLRSPAVRRVAAVAFALYLVVLVGVAFLPLPGDPRPGTVGVVPLDLSLSRPDLLGGWEAQRNVLMTVPFGVLLPLVVRWRYEWLLLACVGVTLVIETGQLLGSLAAGWAWRSFDVDDLLNNTVGALLGLGLTGAALLWQRRRRGGSRRLPVRRLVPGALAGVLVAGALVSTATTPAPAPLVDACAEPPTLATTQLADHGSAYAGADGSVCVLDTEGGTSSLAADTPTGVVSEVQLADGTGWQVGVVAPGDDASTDAAGASADAQPVEGSDLRVWSRPLPQG